MLNRSLLCVVLAACTAPVGEEPGADAGATPDATPDTAPDAAPDAPIVAGTPIAASRPAIATGVGGQLAVWDTERGGTPDIFGTRLSPSGQVLDPDGIAIAVAAGTQIGPRIAFNGERYLVVWKDNRDGVAAIYAARVGADGTVLDPDGIRVAAPGGATQFPDVASDGRDFLVVWEAPCAAPCVHGISGVVVGADGRVGVPARLAPAGLQSYTPAVAFGGGAYVVAWAEIRAGEHDLAARRVAPDGAPGQLVAVSSAVGNQIAPAIASDGAGFLITWQNVRNGLPRTYAARVAGDGTVLDAEGVALSFAGRWRDTPEVAWTGAGYLVAWTEAPDAATIAVKTRAVGSDGSLSEILEPFTAPSAGASPVDDDKLVQLAAIGGRTTPVWQSPFDGSFTIIGAQLDAASRMIAPPTVLSTELAP